MLKNGLFLFFQVCSVVSFPEFAPLSGFNVVDHELKSFKMYLINRYIMKVIFKIIAIWKKNFINNMSNKKKTFSELIFPIIVSFFYYQYKQIQNPIFQVLLKYLLLLYCALITSSSVRQTITLFINERQQGHRQYQMISGLSLKVHTFANLTYMYLYSSIFLLPFYFTLNAYIFNFAALVIPSTTLTIFLTSFFNDHKIATEVIGLFFSLSALLPLFYDPEADDYKHYLAMVMPNSAFSLSIMGQISESQKWAISLVPLSLTKLYMLLYGFIEFREQTVESLKNLLKKICCCCKKYQNNTLKEEIEMESYEENNLAPREKAIEVKNLQKNYGEVLAIQNISVNIYKSQIFGLLGRNGAGKTTLVDVITKVQKPTSGKVTIFNKDNEEIKGKIGICYQKQILYEKLTFRQHLALYSRIKELEEFEDVWNQIIQSLGVEEQVDKKVDELSGGNKRKLSIALALLGNPDILIFDEPTSGLDPLSRRNIWKILEGIKKTDSTVILTTHHLDEADYLSDRICVIQKGKIIEQSTPQKIKNKYGKGHYLIIHHDDENKKFDPQLCRRILHHWIPKAQFIELQSDYIKYFINEELNSDALVSAIQNLQKVYGITISLKPNSLEQSFLKIIQQNMGEYQSLDQLERERVERDERPQTSYSFFRQVSGVILKNFYCFKMKFFYFYFGNLLILAFATVFNKVIKDKVEVEGGDSKEYEEGDQNMTSSFYIVQGYMIMTSAFISIPVYEKQQKIIQLLRTRGLRKLNYWIGHYIFDISMFIINSFIIALFFSKILEKIPNWLILATGTALIIYAYCASMIFSKLKTANSWFTVINLLFSIIFLPLIFIAEQGVAQGAFFEYIVYLKYFTPYYDLSKYLYSTTSQDKNATESPDYVIFYNILLYFLILVFFQSKMHLRIMAKIRDIQTIKIDKQIRFQNVTKKYKQTVALKNVSYTVNQQKLALLGHNGAGKSTSFGLFSCQLTASEGNVYVENQLRKDYKEVMNGAGICYQQNTLWKEMKSEEIIRVFCLICGVEDASKQKNWLFRNIEFEYSTRKFEKLSGGNKRKLCMMAALIGRPNMKFLDECSTGLDPISRMSMVRTIKADKNGCVVFTTHSMGQAEDLCTRVIIMRKGEVIENEKIFKLKAKYMNLYRIQIKLSQQIQVQEAFEEWNPQKIESKDGLLYDIQIEKSKVKLSELLQYLITLKNKKVIQNYRIDEPSLEDVYIDLTRNDENEGNNENE